MISTKLLYKQLYFAIFDIWNPKVNNLIVELASENREQKQKQIAATLNCRSENLQIRFKSLRWLWIAFFPFEIKCWLSVFTKYNWTMKNLIREILWMAVFCVAPIWNRLPAICLHYLKNWTLKKFIWRNSFAFETFWVKCQLFVASNHNSTKDNKIVNM